MSSQCQAVRSVCQSTVLGYLLVVSLRFFLPHSCCFVAHLFFSCLASTPARHRSSPGTRSSVLHVSGRQAKSGTLRHASESTWRRAGAGRPRTNTPVRCALGFLVTCPRHVLQRLSNHPPRRDAILATVESSAPEFRRLRGHVEELRGMGCSRCHGELMRPTVRSVFLRGGVKWKMMLWTVDCGGHCMWH